MVTVLHHREPQPGQSRTVRSEGARGRQSGSLWSDRHQLRNRPG